MDYLDTDSFSNLQTWIIEKKLANMTYESIIENYKSSFPFASGNLSRDAIKTCLKRSSLSLNWTKSQCVGKIPVISDPDVKTLREYIYDNSNEGQFIDVEDTVEKAEELRRNRYGRARQFLTQCQCYGILKEIDKLYDNYEATRVWVYEHLEELQAQLFSPKNIEINRALACTPEKITRFTNKFIPIVQRFRPCLRFAADETMLQPNINRKVLTPNC